ncbi:MAG: fibrobacter succinogenes major paralogous domain-containing protein [Prevotellaceae bacterium]|jgi:uncharacterized protein (TIGR02145 family)|nr:fibrobacter succinogenes major paralogous domain-containing protein [Prevotellaceae bacterium]
MKTIIYSILTLCLGLVLSSGSCSPDAMVSPDPDGVLIKGTIWAKYNVETPGTFAAKPENPGMFYQWNSNKAWPATEPITGTWPSVISAPTTWQDTNNPCPEGWKVPSLAQLETLISSGHKQAVLNGVAGHQFGNGANTIFLRTGGCRSFSGGTLTDSGSTGHYWTSDCHAGTYAKDLYFYGSYAEANVHLMGYGMLVRCVKKP